MPNAQRSLSADATTASVAPQQDRTIVIPAGTRIPLSLSSPIPAKLAKPGYAVRAVTVFPVTVGSEVAIPVGAYVEGMIEKVKKAGSSGPSMQVHFTRMVFASGYAVPVDAANTQAKIGANGSDAPFADATMDGSTGAGAPGFALAAQQAPAPPALHNPGPPAGAVVGITVAVVASTVIGAVLWNRHHAGSSGMLFATGWQFDMVLKSPVSVNAASVAAASGTVR